MKGSSLMLGNIGRLDLVCLVDGENQRIFRWMALNESAHGALLMRPKALNLTAYIDCS